MSGDHKVRKENKMTSFKQSVYWNAWAQAYQLHKKYYGIRPDDAQRWKELDQECERLDKQYEGKPVRKFMQSLLLAIVGELERSQNGETAGTISET